MSLWDFHLSRAEWGDMAEALDEVFFDDGAVALEKAEAVGGGATLDGHALDIRAEAHGDEREAVGCRESNALESASGLDSDLVMLAGERIFLESKSE
jgi:hypothetical protein